MKKTLKQRIEALEYTVYRKWVEVCPRCKNKTMNEWQKDICRFCAYKKGDDYTRSPLEQIIQTYKIN